MSARVGNPLVWQGLIALVMGVVAVVSWQFGYRPARSTYRHDVAEKSTLMKRLADVEAMVTVNGGKDAWMSLHRQRLAQLKARFPTQAELPKILNLLVDVVKSGDLKLLNVAQGNAEPLKESDGPVLIEGMPCYRLLVTMMAEGRYHAIVAAMERFSGDTFQGVVSLKQMELALKKSPGAALSSTLQLDVYLLNPAASDGAGRTGEPDAQPADARAANE